MVVEMEVSLQPILQFRYRGVVLQVDVFVLNGAPKALDKHVVKRAAPTIHTDANAREFQTRREIRGHKLDTLIGVEDHRCPKLERLLQGRQAEKAIEGI